MTTTFTKRYFFHCHVCNGVYDTHAPIYTEPGNYINEYECPDCAAFDAELDIRTSTRMIACCDYDPTITVEDVRAVAAILYDIPQVTK